jgi:hypothetical protein
MARWMPGSAFERAECTAASMAAVTDVVGAVFGKRGLLEPMF